MWWVLGTVAYLVCGAVLVGAANPDPKKIYLSRVAVVVLTWPLFLVAGAAALWREPR